MSDAPVRVTPFGGGVFLVEHADGSRQPAYGAAEGTRVWVFVNGQTHVIETAPSRRTAGSHDAAALAAPMPATVTQVHVTVGQAVTAGDVLITLEAMKMELPIRAAAPGVVTAVNCRVGELVQPGTPLIEVNDTHG